MTHIMWLTNLAPDIQEAILFLPRVASGPDTVKEIRAGLIAIETAQRVPFLENSHPMHHLNPHHPEYPTASHW